MTTPDPARGGLDPVHILAICTAAARSGRGQQALILATPGGIRAFLPSRRMARDACTALARAGYQATTGDGGRRGSREVIVTGWSPAGLESRLAAMRAVLHQLANNPSVTARAVIGRYRDLPIGSPPLAGAQILGQARAQLDAWVSARCGIRAPIHPAAVPADAGTALRLRATQVLEQAIGDLIERHVRVAGHALALFGTLQQQIGGDRAQQTAIRQAGIAFHLSGSAAQDSTALIQDAARTRGAGAPPVPGDAAGPGRRAAREFPAAVPRAAVTARSAAPRLASPRDRQFPAGRQGRRR